MCGLKSIMFYATLLVARQLVFSGGADAYAGLGDQRLSFKRVVGHRYPAVERSAICARASTCQLPTFSRAGIALVDSYTLRTLQQAPTPESAPEPVPSTFTSIPVAPAPGPGGSRRWVRMLSLPAWLLLHYHLTTQRHAWFLRAVRQCCSPNSSRTLFCSTESCKHPFTLIKQS